MGIDFGEKRIGLALSDGLGITAQGLETCKNEPNLFSHLKKLIQEYAIEKIVVGIPRDQKGRIDRHLPVIDFIAVLKEELNLPVETWDERLTTSEAERVLLSADISRRKRKKVRDKLSAQIILQSYLDYNSNIKN